MLAGITTWRCGEQIPSFTKGDKKRVINKKSEHGLHARKKMLSILTYPVGCRQDHSMYSVLPTLDCGHGYFETSLKMWFSWHMLFACKSYNGDFTTLCPRAWHTTLTMDTMYTRFFIDVITDMYLCCVNLSSLLKMPTVRSPSSLPARMILTAISPRLAAIKLLKGILNFEPSPGVVVLKNAARFVRTVVAFGNRRSKAALPWENNPRRSCMLRREYSKCLFEEASWQVTG